MQTPAIPPTPEVSAALWTVIALVCIAALALWLAEQIENNKEKNG
jgi:preprotein translocase subunit SecY